MSPSESHPECTVLSIECVAGCFSKVAFQGGNGSRFFPLVQYASTLFDLIIDTDSGVFPWGEAYISLSISHVYTLETKALPLPKHGHAEKHPAHTRIVSVNVFILVTPTVRWRDKTQNLFDTGHANTISFQSCDFRKLQRVYWIYFIIWTITAANNTHCMYCLI